MFYVSYNSDAFRTLGGMIKNNGGFWYSAKQRWFLNSPKSPIEFLGAEGADIWLERIGRPPVDENSNQKHLAVRAECTFGPRQGAVVPIFYFFITDEYGVVAKYKMGSRNRCPDPSKLTVEFERDDTHPAVQETMAVIDGWDAEFKKQAAERAKRDANSDFVGNIGERIKGLVLNLRKQIDRVDYVTYIMVDDDQNLFYYNTGNWHLFEDVKQITASATVYKHIDVRGIKATVLKRILKPRS